MKENCREEKEDLMELVSLERYREDKVNPGEDLGQGHRVHLEKCRQVWHRCCWEGWCHVAACGSSILSLLSEKWGKVTSWEQGWDRRWWGVCVCLWGLRGSRGFEHHTALQALGLWSWTESRASLPQLVGCSLVAQMVKNLPVMQEIRVWSLRRKWQPLQYSCLENPMDRGAWWATVLGFAELDTTERLLGVDMEKAEVGFSQPIMMCRKRRGISRVNNINYSARGNWANFKYRFLKIIFFSGGWSSGFAVDCSVSIFWGQGFAQHPVSIINASKSLVCLSKVTCKVDNCLKCIFFTYWNEHISFPYRALFNRDDHLTESCYIRGLDTALNLSLGHFLSFIKTVVSSTQDFNWEVRGNFLFSVENGVKVI